MEIREGRGVGPNADHIYLHLDHLPPDFILGYVLIPPPANLGAGLDVRRAQKLQRPHEHRPLHGRLLLPTPVRLAWIGGRQGTLPLSSTKHLFSSGFSHRRPLMESERTAGRRRVTLYQIRGRFRYFRAKVRTNTRKIQHSVVSTCIGQARLGKVFDTFLEDYETRQSS